MIGRGEGKARKPLAGGTSKLTKKIEGETDIMIQPKKISTHLTMTSVNKASDMRIKRPIGPVATSNSCGISEIYTPTVGEHNRTGGLYLSDVKNARNIPKLKERGITHILTLLPGSLMMFPEYTTHGMVQVGVDAQDSYNFQLAPHFKKICQFICEGRVKGCVLVHCAKGISRSVSAVLGYMMIEERIPLQTAYNLVVSKRSIARPNIGFMKQLQTLEAKLFKETQL